MSLSKGLTLIMFAGKIFGFLAISWWLVFAPTLIMASLHILLALLTMLETYLKTRR